MTPLLLLLLLLSGTSGCIISDDLANDLFTPSPIRSIRLVLETEQGDDLVLFSGSL